MFAVSPLRHPSCLRALAVCLSFLLSHNNLTTLKACSAAKIHLVAVPHNFQIITSKRFCDESTRRDASSFLRFFMRYSHFDWRLHQKIRKAAYLNLIYVIFAVFHDKQTEFN